MAWWTRLFERGTKGPQPGDSFRVVRLLYSEDGRRGAEVREFSNGQTYLLEMEQTEPGRYAERHEGRLVGPFDSPEQAERFVTTTPWFTSST